mgnify:CR=1 FL=1
MSTQTDTDLVKIAAPAAIPAVKIDLTPAKINLNFQELKEAIQGHLEKYRGVVVTSETVKDGKDLIKEINLTRKDIDTRRKSEVAKASESVKVFDAQMKELVALHDTALNEIRDQINKFEDEKKVEIAAQLQEKLESSWAELRIRDEFKKASIDGLILLTSQTAKGKLTAKAAGEIVNRVQADRSMQTQTDYRLSELAVKSYEAGLVSPLNRGHIEHFIFDDEDGYRQKLSALLNSEIQREEEAVAKRAAIDLKEKIRAEAAAVAEKETREQIEAKQASTNEPEPASAPNNAGSSATECANEPAPTQPQPASSVGSVIIVTCTFSIPVADSVPGSVVVAAVKNKLIDSGFTTLTDISAARYSNQKSA